LKVGVLAGQDRNLLAVVGNLALHTTTKFSAETDKLLHQFCDEIVVHGWVGILAGQACNLLAVVRHLALQTQQKSAFNSRQTGVMKWFCE
jgi:hypothetical protein